MMRRVGILTFHYCESYGAVLQAYALRKKINEFDDYSAHIVNYVPKTFASYDVYPEETNFSSELYCKRKKFELFLINQCGLNQAFVRDVPNEGYEYFVVGSDQVWNLSLKVLDDYAYLLPEKMNNIRKIAYAPSIGMNIQGAFKYEKIFRRYLPDFDYLSVRENVHANFISELSGKPCCSVLDPTLLLEANEYKKIADTIEINDLKQPYVLMFWLHNDNIQKGIEFSNMIARKYNLNIIHNVYPEKEYMFCRDAKNISFVGVEEFLKYIENATYVVTNSYHATLFAIQFKVPMYIFRLDSINMNERIEDLIYKFNLKDRVVNRYFSPNEINDNVNFDYISEILNIRRKESLGYLKNALEIIN